MNLKLSRTSIAILVLAFALAGYGLLSSGQNQSTEVEASAVLKPARGGARDNGSDTSQVKSSKPGMPDQSPRQDSPGDSDGISARLDQLEARTQEAQQIHDVFAASVPPPPAPLRPALPQRPSAPTFPYTYIGAMQDGNVRTLYLSRSDRVVIARTGQDLDGDYHVDSIGAQGMTVTYIPLHEKQTIALGRGR